MHAIVGRRTLCHIDANNRRRYSLWYEVAEHHETWGYCPVRGTGPTIRSDIPETFGKTVHLLSPEEFDAYEAEHWPTQHAYRQERKEASLASASL